MHEHKEIKISHVGEGEVVLIAGGGRVYTDIAARFCRSTKDLDDIISTPYNKNLVKMILDSGHYAATEFDYFIFGVQGYSRVTEAQLIRKRHANYLISSGRASGKAFSVVLPDDTRFHKVRSSISVPASSVSIISDNGATVSLKDKGVLTATDKVTVTLSDGDILEAINEFYYNALDAGIADEDARYLKPQATEFKAIIGMNAHALRDWFKIRCCNRAQKEIRDMAFKMLKLCKESSPDLFTGAGASCVSLGLCPEMEQCSELNGKIPTLQSFKDAIHTEQGKAFTKFLMNNSND